MRRPGESVRPTPPRKKLNIQGIKCAVVACSGAVVGALSAVSGLGAQMAMGPLLNWMLGLAPDRAQGTALRYAIFVSATVVAIAGYLLKMPAALWLDGLLLVVGGTIGAVVGARFPSVANTNAKRRFWLTLGMFICLATAVQAAHTSPFDTANGHFAAWGTPGRVLLLGLLVGALARVSTISSGILMVPTLHLLGGFTAQESIWLALLAVAIGSLLPAWGYGKRGLIDDTFGSAAILGGIPGGALGALVLASPRIGESVFIFVFAALGMFMSGREVFKIAWAEMPAR